MILKNYSIPLQLQAVQVWAVISPLAELIIAVCEKVAIAVFHDSGLCTDMSWWGSLVVRLFLLSPSYIPFMFQYWPLIHFSQMTFIPFLIAPLTFCCEMLHICCLSSRPFLSHKGCHLWPKAVSFSFFALALLELLTPTSQVSVFSLLVQTLTSLCSTHQTEIRQMLIFHLRPQCLEFTCPFSLDCLDWKCFN